MRPRMRDSLTENTRELRDRNGGNECATRFDAPSPRGIFKQPQNGYF